MAEVEYKLTAKVLPWDGTAEAACLGAALLSPTALETITDILLPEDFFSDKNKKIYDNILEFRRKNENSSSLDRVTFYEFLNSKSVLASCGGLEYIESLVDSAPVSSNAEAYAKIVKDNSLRRKIIEFAESLREEAFNKGLSITDTVDNGCAHITDLTGFGYRGNGYIRLDKVAGEVLEEFGENIKKSEDERKQSGIKTGFDQIDLMTGGFKKDNLIIIAARPSVGKTAFALSMALNMARISALQKKARGNEGKTLGIGIFSLEMSASDIASRMLSMRSGVPLSIINNYIDRTNSNDAVRLYEALEKFSEYNIMIQDDSSITLGDLKSSARKMKRAGADIIFIDYLTMINTPNYGTRLAEHEQIALISKELKSLARELHIPVVCLSQLNREAEGVEPTLANLRASGAIEQDADIVIFLHNPSREKKSVMQRVAFKDRETVTVSQPEITIESFKSSHGIDKNNKDIDPPQNAGNNEKRDNVIAIKVDIAKQRNGTTGAFWVGFARRIVYYCDISQPGEN